MNKKRRIEIGKILSSIEQTKDALSNVINEEYEAQENIPESLQDSEVFSESERCCDCMESALDSIGEAIDELSDI